MVKSKVKRQIIIDTDPGIDDAVAIAISLFSEEFDVKLLTSVMGNVSVQKTTNNILKLLKFFGKNIPVAIGANKPLIREITDASNVHGESGMDGYDFEEGDQKLIANDHAVNAIYKVLKVAKEKVTIIAIGPLTNIALLLKLYPEINNKIEELVLMGGSTARGNKGVMSEFNIHVDPEAAKIVLNSGIKIVVAPLDVGLKALLYPEDTSKIKSLNKTGEMLYSLFLHYRGFGLKNGLKMYDSCAIAYLLKPEMFQIVESFADIELCGEYSYGGMIVDLKNYLKRDANVRICIDINDEMFRVWLIEAIGRCK